MFHRYTTVVVFLAFFLVGLLTLTDYGINWDTINHLPRGQTYLHYFLTGHKDFSDMVAWRSYYQNPESLGIDSDIESNKVPKRSLYQDVNSRFDWYIDIDGNGHPPLGDILSSVFNLVLFQKLSLINDIDSYRVYGVFLSACLVALVYHWARKVYGPLAGVIAALSLSVYPLFFSESHFNTEKDIPETVYWSFLLYCVWRGVTDRSWKFICASGVFFGLALGTKFNILFSVLVIVPWWFIYAYSQLTKKGGLKKIFSELFSKNLKLVLAAAAAPVIGMVIFIATWPYLWQSTVVGLDAVLGFYKSIGTASSTDASYIWHFGINLYPIKWIIYTTPLVILGLFCSGVWLVVANIGERKDKVSLLFLLWLIVPIARVSLPNTNIYGGVRQIMEYIPALAILTGAGAFYLRNYLLVWLDKRKIFNKQLNYFLTGAVLVLMFGPILLKLIQIHPNENVYFNPLIGGLKGAKEKNIPAWGNTFGAGYRQAFVWLNHHAEKGATVGFAFEIMPNFPSIFVRRDLMLDNHSRSGSQRWGEYAVTLTYQGSLDRSYYDNYLEKFLEPVYQASVDGVPVVKVWKNDAEHTRKGFLKEASLEPVVTQTEHGLMIDLGTSRYLSRIEAKFDNQDCSKLSSAYAQLSDDGVVYRRVKGTMPKEDWNVENYGEQPEVDSFIQPFAADKARFIEYIVAPKEACLRNINSLTVYYLPDLEGTTISDV